MERFFGYTRILSTGAPAPGATVEVRETGTATLATIYADNLTPPTAKANPFSADGNGFFFFYARANARYDIQISGGGIPSPYTWSDLSFVDVPSGGIINVKDYGAIGNGVADDTSAIQAALDAAANPSNPFKAILFAGDFRITNQLVLSSTNYSGIMLIGTGIIRPPGHKTRIIYDGPTDATRAMLLVNGSADQCIVKNLVFMAQKKAGFCVRFIGTSLLSCGGWRFEFVTFRQAAVAGVSYGSWPEAFSASNDVDAAQHTFEECEFTECVRGCVIDATNAIAIHFTSCAYNYYNLVHRPDIINYIYIRTTNGYSYVNGGHANGLENADPTTCCFRVDDGGLVIRDIYPEEPRILRMGAAARDVTVSSISGRAAGTTQTRTVNAASSTTPIKITTSTSHQLSSGDTVDISGVNGNTAANGTWKVTVVSASEFTLDGSSDNGVYTNGGTVTYVRHFVYALGNGIVYVSNCNVHSLTDHMRIRVDGTLVASGVAIGNQGTTTPGIYDLGNLQNCEIEGLRPSSVPSLTNNSFLARWQATAGAGVNDTPYDWNLYEGASGAGTLKRSTTGANYGVYTAQMNVTMASGTFVYGLEQVVPIPSNTKWLTAVMTGQIDAGKSPKIIFDALGTNVSQFIRLPGNRFVCWAERDVGQAGEAPITVRGGLAPTDTGNIYIDTLAVFPVRFPFGCEWTALFLPAPEPMPAEHFGTAAPAVGTWRRGDKIWNLNAAAGQPPGWVCVVSGTPGTWAAMANLV